MTLIKHELFERSYTASYLQDQLREETLKKALKQQLDAYKYFATATFPLLVTEAEAAVSVNTALQSLGGINQKHVRFFYTLSLAPVHQYTTTVRLADGESSLRTRWHVHALLGGLVDEIGKADIAHAFFRATGGFADVKEIDGSKVLCDYIASRGAGNRVGALQKTNDRNIIHALARSGQVI